MVSGAGRQTDPPVLAGLRGPGQLALRVGGVGQAPGFGRGVLGRHLSEIGRRELLIHLAARVGIEV